MELIILKVSGPSWWVDVFFSDFFTFCLDKGNLSLTLSLNWQTGSINQPPTGWGRDGEDGEDGEDDQPCLQYLVRGCWWCWHARVWVLTVTACPLPQHQCEAGGRLSWALVCQPLLSTHDSGAARRSRHTGTASQRDVRHLTPSPRHVSRHTSHLSRHTSHITLSRTERAVVPGIWAPPQTVMMDGRSPWRHHTTPLSIPTYDDRPSSLPQ